MGLCLAKLHRKKLHADWTKNQCSLILRLSWWLSNSSTKHSKFIPSACELSIDNSARSLTRSSFIEFFKNVFTSFIFLSFFHMKHLYNMREVNITTWYKNGSWGCRALLLPVILKGITNELTKILIVFDLEVLLTAWDKRNPCAVNRRKRRNKCWVDKE